MGRRFDVTLAITDGMLQYPGNPPVRITAHQRIADGASANVSVLSLGSHTGTHVDAPWHFDDAGAGVDTLPLDHLIGPAVVLGFPDEVGAIGPAELERHDLSGRTRVLLRTRNSRLLEQGEFAPDFAHLTPDGAEWLVQRGVVLVGTDYLSIDRFRSGHHGAHHTLFRGGAVIVEGLALRAVPPGRYRLVCLPLRITGLDGAPARAVLEEE